MNHRRNLLQRALSPVHGLGATVSAAYEMCCEGAKANSLGWLQEERREKQEGQQRIERCRDETHETNGRTENGPG